MCCTPATNEKTAITEVFNLLNQYRAEQGKAALTYDTKLEAAVQGHCEHMVAHGFFEHTAPESAVSSPLKRANLCGTSPAGLGENLAGGQSTPASAMTGWKNSSGHNSNMLADWKRVGICRKGNYWGQLFAN